VVTLVGGNPEPALVIDGAIVGAGEPTVLAGSRVPHGGDALDGRVSGLD